MAFKSGFKIYKPQVFLGYDSVLATLPAEMFEGSDFWLETRVIIKISTHSWYPRNFDQLSWVWREENKIEEKKSKMADSKKTEFFKIVDSQDFFAKISWIGPRVSRIDWCKGQWCGPTYMAVRLSDVSSKTGKIHKKCIFCLFLSLRRTASQPYRLSHINVLPINQSYWPKDQSTKFGFFFQKKYSFLLHPHENLSKFPGYQGWVGWLPWFPAKNHSP